MTLKCNGIKLRTKYVEKCIEVYDIVYLQETWFTPKDEIKHLLRPNTANHVWFN
jgi:exonuclease III